MLTAAEEEAKEEEGPMATLEPEIDIVWTAELTGETPTAEEAVAVEGALAPPDDDAAGATTAPMGPSAAAPSMMIDTAIASHTALLRGVIGQVIVTPTHDLNLWDHSSTKTNRKSCRCASS